MLKNNVLSFRCTTEEKKSLLETCRKKNMTLRDYILNMHANNSGFIDKEGLKILFNSMFEHKLAKKLIRRYCYA